MRNDFCSNYLAHSAKGTSWKNAKYVKKEMGPNGKWLYFYSWNQYNAYKKYGESRAPVQNKKLAEKAKKQAKDKKEAELKKSIETGAQKISEQIEKEESKKKGSGSSSKSDSILPATGKGKGGSSSKSSDKAKAEKGSSSSKSAKAEKTATSKTQSTKTVNKSPITLSDLKNIYGKKDEDVTTHTKTASEFKSDMLSKYDDGSYGYLMAGGKAYKWSIEGGDIVLKDFDSDKEVSFNDYLKDAKQFEEFQTSSKKKK